MTFQSLINFLNDAIETVHKFNKSLHFMKIDLPPTFIFRHVRPRMIMHAFVIELDQPDY